MGTWPAPTRGRVSLCRTCGALFSLSSESRWTQWHGSFFATSNIGLSTITPAFDCLGRSTPSGDGVGSVTRCSVSGSSSWESRSKSETEPLHEPWLPEEAPRCVWLVTGTRLSQMDHRVGVAVTRSRPSDEGVALRTVSYT